MFVIILFYNFILIASDAVEDPWPPNCISDLKDFKYMGTQWTNVDQLPCIPWISSQVKNLYCLHFQYIKVYKSNLN